MKQDDEVQLMAELRRRVERESPNVRDILGELHIDLKRAAFICKKWSEQGLYEYGTNVLAGWISDKAIALDLDKWSES